jgi:hypothetical protein
MIPHPPICNQITFGRNVRRVQQNSHFSELVNRDYFHSILPDLILVIGSYGLRIIDTMFRSNTVFGRAHIGDIDNDVF